MSTCFVALVHLRGRVNLSVECSCAALCSVAQVCPTLCDPWTAALQAPLSIGFSRREHWSGLPCPPPGGLPNPGIKARAPALREDSLQTEPPGKPRKFIVLYLNFNLKLCLTELL